MMLTAAQKIDVVYAPRIVINQGNCAQGFMDFPTTASGCREGPRAFFCVIVERGYRGNGRTLLCWLG
jgi:hypothetical protein